MSPKIAVILFPGTNCELEALRACERAHMTPKLVRWNETETDLKKFDGFILPGGFSYEDRGRSAVVAAKDPVFELIKAEAHKGKPVLGICNGAQMLIESGMVPGLNEGKLEMGLAWNERIKQNKLLGIGFYNEWVYMRSDVRKNRTPFNRFSNKVIMKIPVANGEGRYTTTNKHLLKTLIANEQTVLRFCDENGNIEKDFPINPNGALYNIAGICNPQGNVMSMMPHPERTLLGQPIFDSLADFYKASKKTAISKPAKLQSSKAPNEDVKAQTVKPDFAIKISLIITDNEERTIENAMKRVGFEDLKLKRKVNLGFFLGSTKLSAKEIAQLAEKAIQSGEIVNLNKETPEVVIGNTTYSYSKTNGLEPKENHVTGKLFLAKESENYLGKNVFSALQPYFPASTFKKIERGVEWDISVKNTSELNELISTHIFHNPSSMELVTLN